VRAVVVAVLALIAASSALADRPAKPAERAAIIATVAHMGSFDPGPAACNQPIIRVSTWDPDYATWRARVWTSGPCAKYGAGSDGLNFFKHASGSWLFLARSPAVPECGGYVDENVPIAVLADFLHCPGGPSKGPCFTLNGPGFTAASAADASLAVDSLMRSCYRTDYSRVTRVGFTAMPRPHGTAVSLVVKTKLTGAKTSVGDAKRICQDASIAAKWFGYSNFKVSVVAGSAVLSHATWVTGHIQPC
jgi:hypothetical protein